jgi:hypothetical protein
LNYNNSIKDARLQNNSALAEIAYKALQQQLELSLQGFQYKNQLLIEKANKKTEVENNYYNRYQNVLAQINQENALAEQVRQYNENLALQKAKFEEEKRQYNEQMALAKSKSSSSGGSSGGSNKSSGKVKSSSSSSSKNSSSKVKSSSSGTVSAKDKLNLGYGPINDKAVENLVRSGAVEVVTDKNGKNSLKKTSSAPAKLNNTKTKATTTSLVKRLFK